jgi:hypothetical protein
MCLGCCRIYLADMILGEATPVVDPGITGARETTDPGLTSENSDKTGRVELGIQALLCLYHGVRKNWSGIFPLLCISIGITVV